MHEYPILIFAALLILVYGMFSRLTERSPVSAAMVFVSVGMLASPLGFDLIELGLTSNAARIIAELTLVLVLFIDASTIDIQSLVRRKGLPLRLLGVGLPLTIVLGFGAALPLYADLGLWTVALMALMLSPTDAALGQPVITSPLVPGKIKEAINVESGVNDGIVLPPILACIAALSVSEAERHGVNYWVLFTMKQLILGPIVGAVVGWAGGRIVDWASEKGWMLPMFQRLSAFSLALLAFALAEEVNGNGYIAAFSGGLFLGVHSHEVRERMHEFGEAEGQQLGLFVFLMFGLAAVPKAVEYWDARAWFYALLSLTVIRMLPVALCLIGTGLSRFSTAFIGWFGPRGIASALYLVIVANELGPGYMPMLAVVVLTVLLSVFLHGITAVPLAKLYAHRHADDQD
jgi:sodium/hydrogen antiporter